MPVDGSGYFAAKMRNSYGRSAKLSCHAAYARGHAGMEIRHDPWVHLVLQVCQVTAENSTPHQGLWLQSESRAMVLLTSDYVTMAGLMQLLGGGLGSRPSRMCYSRLCALFPGECASQGTAL